MERETMLTVLVGILVLMAGVQAVQISSVNDALSTGSVSVATTTTQSTSSASSSGGSVPSLLQNIPSQVGGC